MREFVEGEKDEIIAKGRKHKEEARGWSLADLEARTGIDQATLSRFETGVCGNPTIATLNRFASALGKQMVISLWDKR